MEKGILVQYCVALALSLMTLTMGVTSGWATPVLPKFKNNETHVEINEDQIAWMLGLSAPGFLSGTFATMFMTDRFGRRLTLLASALPISLGTIIVVAANKAWMLFIMKYFWGFGTGMISTVITVYLAEIADKNVRASLSVITRIGFNFGNFIVMSFGSFISYEILNYCILSLPVIFFLSCLWIPESPYYHLRRGNVFRARKELVKIRNSTEEADAELETMKADVKKDMRQSSTALELFRGKQYRKALIISAGLKMAQILTGALTIQQYLGSIIQESKTDIKISTALIIFGVVKFAVGIMSSVVADRVGRRPLLIYSFIGNGIALILVGNHFFLQNIVDSTHLAKFGFVPLAGIILSNVISTLGFNSIIGIIPAEIFPLNIKTVAMTALNIFGGILGFGIAKGYQEVKNHLGHVGAFWGFAAISIISAVFAYLVVPETKGKSLGEIQALVQGFDLNGEIIDENNTELKDLKKSSEI